MTKNPPAATGPLRLAAVGLGWVTLHRHLPAMRRTAGIEVVGLADRRAGRAQAVAQACGIARYHQGGSLAAIPWLEEIDAFSIGTPPMSHAPLIQEALELGRHVITEKPFAMSVAEGEQLVALARERRRTLAVVHNFQFARSALRLLDDMRSERFGRVSYLHAQQLGNPARRLPPWHEELPLGLFYDESPHMLYLLRRVAPEPLRFLRAEVHSSRRGKNTPAWISAHYAAGADAVPVKLDMGFEAPLSEWHVSLAGERGLGAMDVFRDIYMRLPNDGAHTSWPVLRTSIAATWAHWSQHLLSGPRHLAGSLLYGNEEVFRRFAEAARASSRPAQIGPEDALAVLRMQHEIIEHAERMT
jgi:predicted dehydrogenase